MASFMRWLNNLPSRAHLLLGKLTRLIFYLGLASLGSYYIISANIIDADTQKVTLEQIFSTLVGGGILIITLFAFFRFPEESNPLAPYGIYRSVWGNIGLLIIGATIIIFFWLSRYDHFDEPLWQRVFILLNDIYGRIIFGLNELFK